MALTETIDQATFRQQLLKILKASKRPLPASMIAHMYKVNGYDISSNKVASNLKELRKQKLVDFIKIRNGRGFDFPEWYEKPEGEQKTSIWYTTRDFTRHQIIAAALEYGRIKSWDRKLMPENWDVFDAIIMGEA